MTAENYTLIQAIADNDVVVLKAKGKHYGNSWKKRGGVGAFMMLARKWDRIENMVEAGGYDSFKVARDTIDSEEGLLETIADLRRYLLLVEAEVRDEGAGLKLG